MFNKRLQHDFIIPNAGLHRVYLLEESETGGEWPVIKGEGEPVKLPTGNPNNKIYTPILPGILTWRIVIRNQAERDVIDAVFESIEGDYRVEYYQVEGGITENLIWRGDLLLDQYNEDLRGFPGFVEIVASDLGKLQGLNYLDVDGFPHTGRESQLQIIKNCVQLLGYDLGFACSDAIYEDTMDGNPLVDDPMLQAYADNAWYYPVDSFGQARLMSAWDVLRSILVSKACRIRQWGGRWHVEQIGPGVEPLPVSDGNFVVGLAASASSEFNIRHFDGESFETILSPGNTDMNAVIASYVPEQGGEVIVLSNNGRWRKYLTDGTLVWEALVEGGSALIGTSQIVRSKYGYYAAWSAQSGATRYVSCVDEAGNVIYDRTVDDFVNVIGFDEALNTYFVVNQSDRAKLVRLAINGATDTIDIEVGDSNRVLASAMNADGKLVTQVQGVGWRIRELDGTLIDTVGGSFAADFNNSIGNPLEIDYQGNYIYRRSDIFRIRKVNPFTETEIFSFQIPNSIQVNDIRTDTFNRTLVTAGAGTGANQYVIAIDTDGTELARTTGGLPRNISFHPGLIHDITPRPVVTPPAPINLARLGDDDAVELFWMTPPSPTIITGYRIYQDNIFIAEVGFPVNQHRVEELNYDQEYEFKITAINPAGESGFSNTVAITLNPPGGGSTDFSEYTTAEKPSDWTLQWDGSAAWDVREVAGATGGKVLRNNTGSASQQAISWDEKDLKFGILKTRCKRATWSTGFDAVLVGRGSGNTSGRTGYWAVISSNQFRLSKRVGGTFTTMDSEAATVANDTWYNIELEMTDDVTNNIKARFYTDAQGPSGGVELVATDSSIDEEGWSGLYKITTGITDFDTFDVTNND